MKDPTPTLKNSKLVQKPAPLTTTGDLRRSQWMIEAGSGRVVKQVNPATKSVNQNQS